MPAINTQASGARRNVVKWKRNVMDGDFDVSMTSLFTGYDHKITIEDRTPIHVKTRNGE